MLASMIALLYATDAMGCGNTWINIRCYKNDSNGNSVFQDFYDVAFPCHWKNIGLGRECVENETRDNFAMGQSYCGADDASQGKWHQILNHGDC
jgi:hypothetical protein